MIVQPETVIAWRRRKPPSATWRTFLKNHVKDVGAVDFFVVPTVRNQILFVFLILAHHRRRVLHFNVTAKPTAAWATQQIVEAFPWDEAPRFLHRDRDHIYGESFSLRLEGMGIEEVIIAPRSPWQNPFIERHLKRILTCYFACYHRWRCHQSLEMDCPDGRDVQPAGQGPVIEVEHLGGLHHHYERTAAWLRGAEPPILSPRPGERGLGVPAPLHSYTSILRACHLLGDNRGRVKAWCDCDEAKLESKTGLGTVRDFRDPQRDSWKAGLETESRIILLGHEGGNPGYRQGRSYGPPRQFPTLPGLRDRKAHIRARRMT